MVKKLIIFFIALCISRIAFSQPKFDSDVIQTSYGRLEITFIHHATLMFRLNDMVIYVDPVSQAADFSKMPKASLVLVTHQHGDHFDKKTIDQISIPGTTSLILTQTCYDQISKGIVMKNGDVKTIKGLKIEAVPAYNLVHKNDKGEFYHPKGTGNGYVINFGDTRVYVAGDTENIPEMKELKDIDIAFLPMNMPYTMTPEMVLNAVNMFHPAILYPYHFSGTDMDQLKQLLKGYTGTELRIRKFY